MRKIETKKLAAAVTALALCAGVLTGCGGAASGTASSTAASSASSEASSEEADEMAAKNVADLIDAIYVQERNEDTDAQCEAAKAAWDALTDTQKELVEGENADPDYFGRDTGDLLLFTLLVEYLFPRLYFIFRHLSADIHALLIKIHDLPVNGVDLLSQL